MRRSGLDPPVRLSPVYRVERIERAEQTIDVFGIAGMNQIQVKCRNGSALKHGGDAADYDEVDLMRKKNAQNF